MRTKLFDEKVIKAIPYVRKYCLLRCSSYDDAIDMCQNVVLKALNNPVDDNRNIASWMLMIARNEIINSWKRSEHYKLIIASIELKTCTNPDQEIFTDYNIIMSELENVNPFHREMLKKYARGFMYREIAEESGNNINNVKTWIRCAREELNKRLL